MYITGTFEANNLDNNIRLFSRPALFTKRAGLSLTGFKGMTFLEVLIAIVIVGMVLSAIYSGLSFAYKYARHNANKTMALNFAQGLMEEIKDKNYEDPEDPNDHTGAYTNYLGPEDNDAGLDDVDDYNGYEDIVYLYQKEGVNIQANRTVVMTDQNGDAVLDSGEYANIAYKQVTVTVSWAWLDNPEPYIEEINTIISTHN